jgi:hypothetical protein
MNPNVWLPVLTAALVLVSAYYAWTVHNLLRTTGEMVSATKEMVETSLKTYILSVAPQVVCRTVVRVAADPQPAGEPTRPFVAETTITNLGPHRMRLTRVRLESDSEAEQVRRFIDKWLVASESELVRIPLGKADHIKVFVHFDDIASQSHIAIAQQAPGEP